MKFLTRTLEQKTSSKAPAKSLTLNFRNGFTILETLVAISILVLSLTAPLTIVSQALRSSYYSRDQITAYYLAQEAVEFLRNKRDNAGLQSSTQAENWTDLFKADATEGVPGSGTSVINPAGSESVKAYLERNVSGYRLVSCSGSCPEVSYDSSALQQGSNQVLYGAPGASGGSVFVREIVLNVPPTGTNPSGAVTETNPELRELVITVRVKWRMSDGTMSDGVTIKEHLTNWQLEKTTT